MILAAGLLVLVGLALFVAGIATDVTVLYWLCVAACVVAGVLLVAARLRIGRAAPARADAPPATTETQPPAPAGATAVSAKDDLPAPPPAAGDPAVPAADAPTDVARPVSAPAEPATGEREAVPAAHARRGTTEPPVDAAGDPPVEEVEVTDLLLVVDLRDEVLVVDEHPRYHLSGCRWVGSRETIPLPLDEARTDGFTPCGVCSPDRTLAELERGRRAGRTG